MIPDTRTPRIQPFTCSEYIVAHRVLLRRSALTEPTRRRGHMQVKDGMSQVSVSVGPTHTLREAARRMVEKKTGAALVVDADLPTPSVVTERDLLISVARGESPDEERVGEHMSEGVIA